MKIITLICWVLIVTMYMSVSVTTAQDPVPSNNSTLNLSLDNVSELLQNTTEYRSTQIQNSTNGTINEINITQKNPDEKEVNNEIIVAYDPLLKNVVIKNQKPDFPIPTDLKQINIEKIKILSGNDVKHVKNKNKDNKLTYQTLSAIQQELDINDPSGIEVELELDEIRTLLNNKSIEATLKNYNITLNTSSASISQYETENSVIVNLNNKSDGTWYRLTADVPEDRGITGITIRYDDGSTRQITNWTRNGTTVWFYDDPASVYEITTFNYEGSETPEQTINFPISGGSNGSVLIEIPRSANIIDIHFDINTSDTLTNLRLDMGANGDLEWGPVNFNFSNSTFTLNNSNAGLVNALNALIPLVDNDAIGVNYTYDTISNNVTIELNFSSDSQGSLQLSNIYVNYSLWQNMCGNVSGNVILSDGSNDLHNWAWVTNAGNVYIIDNDSDINWSALKPLGKQIDGSPASADFIDISQNLYMQPGYNLSDAFSSDGAIAFDITSFTIFGNTITNVPIVNSTDRNNHNYVASANFITGILWDSSDDGGNNEYDTSDREDIVFVAKINNNKISEVSSSPHDYELIIPSHFGSYKGTDGKIAYYVELN